MKNTLLISVALLISSAGYGSINKDNAAIKKHYRQDVYGSEVDPSLWRGVNLPLALNSSRQNTLNQADFDYCARAGANVIRLSVHADDNDIQHVDFFDASGKILPADKSAGIAGLKTAVQMAKKANLKVIIDMHTSPGRKSGEIWTDQAYWDKLADIWEAVATAFKNDPTVVAFDLMNEPNIITYIKTQNFVSKGFDEGSMYAGTWSPPQAWKNTPRDYNLQITKLIGAIRDIDDNRYVIVEGFGNLGNPVNFNWMKPIEGFSRVIYSFHMYVPTGLTMLGTKGSKQKGDEDEVKAFSPAADESKIDKAFEPVIAFQKKYHVPIFVGEFGITDDAINGSDASGKPYNGACWLSLVIKKMQANNWGWAYWTFWANNEMKPKSDTDPRYVILSAAMKGETIPDYCK